MSVYEKNGTGKAGARPREFEVHMQIAVTVRATDETDAFNQAVNTANWLGWRFGERRAVETT